MMLAFSISALAAMALLAGAASIWLANENRRLREDLANKNEAIDALNSALAGDSRRGGSWDVL